MAQHAGRMRTGMLACALFLVVSAVQGLGFGPFAGLSGNPPGWVADLLRWLLVSNLALAVILWWRGLHVGTSAGLVAVGIPSMLSTLVLATFSIAIDPPLSLSVAGIAGLGMASWGVWTVEFDTLCTAVVEHRHVIGVVAIVVFAIEAAIGAIATAIYLLPALWANGAGIGLLPLFVLAGIRWLSTAGITVDDRFGVRLSDVGAGYQWRLRRAVQLSDRVDVIRVTCIGLSLAGVTLIAIAPLFGPPVGGIRILLPCMTPTWDTLDYEVIWHRLYFEWDNGCRVQRTMVNETHTLVGGFLGTTGVLGERLARISNRIPGTVPTR